jgi:hypothetical protein
MVANFALIRPNRHVNAEASPAALQDDAASGILATQGDDALCQVQADGSSLVHDFPTPVIERGNSIVAFRCLPL